MNYIKWMLAAAVLGFAIPGAKAETVTIAAGEWAPLIGEELPDNGTHSKRVREVLKAAGYELELVFQPWKRTLETSRKGDFVGTFSWSRTPDREESFYFPEVPIEVQQDVVYYSRKNHPNGLEISSVEDIKTKGLKAVGLAGYWYEGAFAELGIEAQIVTSVDAAFKLLRAGRADVLIESESAGDASMREILGADDETVAKGSVLRSVGMYLMFSKAHPMAATLRDAWDAHAQ